MRTSYMVYQPVICHSDLYGEVIPKDKIIKLIEERNLEITLIALSRLMCLQIDLMSENVNSRFFYTWLKNLYMWKTVLPNHGNLEEYYKGCLFCVQSLFMLYKWLVAYGVEHKEDSIYQLSYNDFVEVIDLCIMINDYLPKDEVVGNETAFIYTNIYHNTIKDIKNQLARAYYIFVKLMDENKMGCKYTEDFINCKGYSIKDYLSISFNMLMLNNYDLSQGAIFAGPYLKLSKGFNACQLQDVYPLVVKDISSTIEKLRTEAQKKADYKWDFELFYRYPLLEFTDNGLLNISPITLQYQFFEGLFWQIRFLYKEKQDVESFFRDFGRPFEKYVQTITFEAAKSSKSEYFFQNEFEYILPHCRHKSPDCFLRKGNQVLIIEAKAKSPHSSTLKGYDIEKIHEEVVDLLVVPIHQVDCRVREILSDDITFPNDKIKEYFNGINEIYIISVSIEKIQPVNDLLQFADKFLKSGELQVVLDDKPINCKVSNPQIVMYTNFSIEDFEAICSLVENRIDIFPLLQEFFNIHNGDKKEVVPFRNFLNAKDLSYNSSSFVQSELQKVFDIIYENIFGTCR